jgi:hypothetical protein
MIDITLDDWQKKFLNTEGDRVLCCGRQVGKSVICSRDAGEKAVKKKNINILMIAPTERQAYALFEKTLTYLIDNHSKMIMKGKNRPTKTKISLINGTKIYCLPTGMSGIGIRFLTVHELYADEASRIPEDVWAAVTPMLLTTGGNTTLLSTPAGGEGYFADVVENRESAFDSYARFAISSMEVIKTRTLCATWSKLQRDKAIEHIEREEKRMTKRQFAQEYVGMIVEDLRQFFPTDLIRECMNRTLVPRNIGDNFLGVDVARLGEDETVLYSLKRINKTRLEEIDMEITKKKRLTDTSDRIKIADKQHHYKKIYIDDAGVGGGVFDTLLIEQQTKRKIVSINNATKSLDNEEKRKKKLLKEDLYNNLLNLMERGLISLKNNEETFLSLKSIQYEYTENKNIRIFGRYSHITEALVRAAWCIKDKGLNIWIC